MAAIVQIVRKTGGSGAITVTDITSIISLANAYDWHSTGNISNAIQIPAQGLITHSGKHHNRNLLSV